MFIRAIGIDMLLPGAASLKDKRQTVQSIIQTLRRRYNISIAETDQQDQRQRARIGMVFLSNEIRHLDSIQQEIIQFIETTYPVDLLQIEINDY